jgi:hypothetical protein
LPGPPLGGAVAAGTFAPPAFAAALATPVTPLEGASCAVRAPVRHPRC